MKRVFEIEWQGDTGPLWMNEDNLLMCLTTKEFCGPKMQISVRDITGDKYGKPRTTEVQDFDDDETAVIDTEGA